MKTFLLASTAALALSAAPALASDGVVKPTPFYFQCEAAPALLTNFFETAAWTAEAPTTSLQEGGGCLTIEPAVEGAAPGNSAYDFVAGGDYGGEVAQVDVTLYGGNMESALFSEITGHVTVIADGEIVAEADEAPAQVTALDTPGTFKATWTLLLDEPLPALTRAREWQITTSGYYSDIGHGIWARGASDAPSGVTFHDVDDLPPVEEEEF